MSLSGFKQFVALNVGASGEKSKTKVCTCIQLPVYMYVEA